MYQVGYQYRFDYRYVPGNPGLYPVVDIQLSRENFVTSFPALIDTGSQLSLISGEHALLLGIPITSGKQARLYTLSGAIITWSHAVHVQILDLSFEMELCFSEFNLPRNLLGRNLLEKLEIGLSEQSSALYVSPSK